MTELEQMEFVEHLKSQWMAMIDAVDDALVIIDTEFNIIRQNLAYVNYSIGLGCKNIKDVKGKKCFEIFANRKSPCLHCQIKEVSLTDTFVTWTTKELFNDKEFEIRIKKTLDNKQYVVHYRDITERVLMQERLAQTDKLAALGKLAGGVAHEINSPLAGILAFAQIVLKEIGENDPHRADLLEIEDAARKCKNIVEGLLGFARQERHNEEQNFDIYACIRSALRLTKPLLKKHKIDLHDNLPEVPFILKGVQGKFSQVFLNLITNSIYAMKDAGGILDLYCQEDNNKLHIFIEDTGVGIEEENIKYIFDPFFTTKPIGDGTGLGLSIAYSIIKQYGGEISLTSILGEGTIFKITLAI